MTQIRDIYPAEAEFDVPALVRGLNMFSGAKNLGAPAECEVHTLLVAGQYKDAAADEGLIYRVITVYKHKSGVLGLLANDITERLLRDMELAGKQ